MLLLFELFTFLLFIKSVTLNCPVRKITTFILYRKQYIDYFGNPSLNRIYKAVPVILFSHDSAPQILTGAE